LLGVGDTEAGRRFLPPAAQNRYRVDRVRLHADDFFALPRGATITPNTQERINALAGALQLVRGTIGTGEATSWGWASQHLATIEAAIIDAALELAELATLQQDWKLADWAATRTQIANPHEQRGLPYAIRARRELGDRTGIQRLHDTPARQSTSSTMQPRARFTKRSPRVPDARAGRCGSHGMPRKSCCRAAALRPNHELAAEWVAEIVRDFADYDRPRETRPLGRSIARSRDRLTSVRHWQRTKPKP